MIGIRFRAYCSFALLACHNTPRPFVVSAFITSSNNIPTSIRSSKNNNRLETLLAAVGHHHHRRSFSSTTTSLAMSSSSEPSLEIKVGAQLQEVQDKITKACEAAGRDPNDVRLVAVSKTKPLELVKDAYDCGQRIFGENYAQELVEKAGAMDDRNDVTWHFIGGLQSNKANMLVKGVVPYGKLVVETVSSAKVANKLNNAMSTNFEGQSMDVFVQINTSGEDSKSGISPDDALELCQHITNECGSLNLKGLMTIGAPGDDGCLDALAECRNKVADAMGMDAKDLGLSMGMSGDYEVAIQKGSTNVRVGSTIFGARDYSNKA